MPMVAAMGAAGQVFAGLPSVFVVVVAAVSLQLAAREGGWAGLA